MDCGITTVRRYYVVAFGPPSLPCHHADSRRFDSHPALLTPYYSHSLHPQPFLLNLRHANSSSSTSNQSSFSLETSSVCDAYLTHANHPIVGRPTPYSKARDTRSPDLRILQGSLLTTSKSCLGSRYYHRASHSLRHGLSASSWVIPNS